MCSNEFSEYWEQSGKKYAAAIGYERCGDSSENWVKLLSWYLPNRKNYSGTTNWYDFYAPVSSDRHPYADLYHRGDFNKYIDPLTYQYQGESSTPGRKLQRFRDRLVYLMPEMLRAPVFTLVQNFAEMTHVITQQGKGTQDYYRVKEKIEYHLSIAGEVGETYLFETVKNRAHIENKIQNLELDTSLIKMYAALLEDQSAYDKQVAVYLEASEAFSPASPEEERFRELFTQFYEVESCYLARRDYVLVYLSPQQFERARTKFREKSVAIDIDDFEKDLIMDEIRIRRQSVRDLEISTARYTDERKTECSMFLFAL